MRPALALLVAFLVSATAHAKDKKDCRPPDWAPTPLPGFDIGSCEERDWDDVRLSIDGKSQWVAGHRVSVTYGLVDRSRNPSAATARAYYEDAEKKAGGTMMKSNLWSAYLKKSGPAGDVWLLYDHGSGNEQSTSSYTVTTLEVKPLPEDVVAKPMPGALDATNEHCGNPPWIVKTFPGYAITSCDAREWDAATVSLDKGSVDLAGRRASVYYQLADEKQVVVPHAMHREFLEALKKSGAEIRRAGGEVDGGPVIATMKTPAGEFWFDARGTGGSEDWTTTYSLTTWQIGPLAQEVEAKPLTGALDTNGCEDPPWLVKQFPYFHRKGCRNRDFDAIEVPTRDGRRKIAGRIHEVSYELTDQKRNPVALAVWTNYVNALQAVGAELVSDPKNHGLAAFTRKSADGEVWYVYSHSSGSDETTNAYTLTTVQVGGPPPKKCTMEIYGVNFDFNQATLRPDSEPVLSALLALFQKDAKLAGEISGHTDDVGKKDYNQKLSAERAEAVKAWLVGKGIAAARLTTRGYGDSRPLVPNTNDENRAKNRRVEFTRENCGK